MINGRSIPNINSLFEASILDHAVGTRMEPPTDSLIKISAARDPLSITGRRKAVYAHTYGQECAAGIQSSRIQLGIWGDRFLN